MEAAVKSAAEQDELGTEFFEDINMKVRIPRRTRMKDQVRVTRPSDTPVRTSPSDSLFIILIIPSGFSLETSPLSTFHRGRRSTS